MQVNVERNASILDKKTWLSTSWDELEDSKRLII